MKFKNQLEEQCYEIAKRALGNSVAVEHNKKIQIERALYPEVASFSGPPTKEIDILTAKLLDKPKIVLLTSCKQLSVKAEPAHVQEWGAVVQTMNKYGGGTLYLGLIVCPNGFTNGCEPWSTSHNIGLLPPLKGSPLTFSEESVLHMFERVLYALRKRLRYPFRDMMRPPAFYDFVYSIVADYEGHEEAAHEKRYFKAPKGWLSSFAEMYSSIADLIIEDLFAIEGATIMKLSSGIRLRFDGNRVDYGQAEKLEEGVQVEPVCRKNIEMEPCTFEFIKSIAVGKRITSAGDFGMCIEYGLNQHYNLGLHTDGFHIFSTENPLENHEL
jgi:hypothetical protein